MLIYSSIKPTIFISIYLIKVGKEFTIKMDLDLPTWRAPDYFPVACPGPSPTPSHRFVCVCVSVCVRLCVCAVFVCVCGV